MANWTTTTPDNPSGYLIANDNMAINGGEWASNPYVYAPSGTITLKYNLDNRKEEPRMRGLYNVYVVDPRKQGKLLDTKLVIAETEEQALLKAGVAETAEKNGLELEQVDTHVEIVDKFIRPRKETQKVKVVKDDD
uniref:Uncharacterized protein n=1 Tax=viral metagenome TaxID=1070528 RepID=A0A6M3LXW3_9ZZZZ